MARPCGVVKKKINFFAEMFCLTQGQGKITNECSSPSPPELSSSLLSPPRVSSSRSWFPPYVFPPSRVPAFQGPCLALSQEVQELSASTSHHRTRRPCSWPDYTGRGGIPYLYFATGTKSKFVWVLCTSQSLYWRSLKRLLTCIANCIAQAVSIENKRLQRSSKLSVL